MGAYVSACSDKPQTRAKSVRLVVPKASSDTTFIARAVAGANYGQMDFILTWYNSMIFRNWAVIPIIVAPSYRIWTDLSVCNLPQLMPETQGTDEGCWDCITGNRFLNEKGRG